MLSVGLAIGARGQVLRPSNVKKGGVNSAIQGTKSDTVSHQSVSTMESKVKYTAEDSIRFDRIHNVVYLYGKARITYDDVELDADYIRLDQKNEQIFAKGYQDTVTNRYRGRPILKQGNEPPFTTDSLVFNFKTKKGKSYGTFTSVEQGYLQAKEFKKNEFGEGFFKNGIYSTCNLAHPHFGIHMTKGIVGEKQIVSGPFYMNIEDVPTPLGLPFGFFPKTNRRASGILFPSYTDDATRGFMIKDLGYYLNISDYWDLKVITSFYTKGTFISNAEVRYDKRYRHYGNIRLGYSWTYPDNDSDIRKRVEGTPGYLPQKDFKITWTHTQRDEANPGTRFSASVDVGSSSYNQNTAAGGSYDMSQITKNTLASSISYGKNMGLFNFTASLGHNQDIKSRTISLQLPQFNLGMNTIYPFDKKSRSGDQKWYQKISLGYSTDGTNSINTYDSLLFKPKTLKMFKTGIQHNIPVKLSMNVFKFFTFSPSIQYNETWYTQTVYKRYVGAFSATDNPKTVTDTIPGFDRAYSYSFSTGLSTKLYGQVNFKKGRVVALRHVATPAISFNYNPDFGDDRYGFYRNVEGVPDAQSQLRQRYSRFENGPYSGPSQGKVASIGFSLDNNIEMKKKAKGKQDSTATSTSLNASAFNKIPILQSLIFSGNYNFAADSLQLSTINVSARNSFFKQKVNLNVSGVFDPYQSDANGNRINQFTLADGKLARLTSLNVSFDLNLNSSAFKKVVDKSKSNLQNMNPLQSEQLARINRDLNAFVDFNVPWNLTARYNLQYSKPGITPSILTHSVNFNGDVSVTPKWKIGFNSGFDFINHVPVPPTFTIYRDLHCWDLSFSWIPQGPYRSYNIDLKVKASVLQDLKLSKRRNYSSNIF